MDGPFQSTKQWYPVAAIEFLDPGRPHPILVLGIDLVLWRDGAGVWQCFADACPHRLAPLSEGRVEADGTLLCAYHAWRFNGEGQCVRIPQSKDAATEAAHCSNPKSNAAERCDPSCFVATAPLECGYPPGVCSAIRDQWLFAQETEPAFLWV